MKAKLINEVIKFVRIKVKGFTIEDPGDPTVGIFPAYWDLDGEMEFEDGETKAMFIQKLKEAFEYLTGDIVKITEKE